MKELISDALPAPSVDARFFQDLINDMSQENISSAIPEDSQEVGLAGEVVGVKEAQLQQEIEKVPASLSDHHLGEANEKQKVTNSEKTSDNCLTTTATTTVEDLPNNSSEGITEDITTNTTVLQQVDESNCKEVIESVTTTAVNTPKANTPTANTQRANTPTANTPTANSPAVVSKPPEIADGEQHQSIVNSSILKVTKDSSPPVIENQQSDNDITSGNNNNTVVSQPVGITASVAESVTAVPQQIDILESQSLVVTTEPSQVAGYQTASEITPIESNLNKNINIQQVTLQNNDHNEVQLVDEKPAPLQTTEVLPTPNTVEVSDVPLATTSSGNDLKVTCDSMPPPTTTRDQFHGINYVAKQLTRKAQEATQTNKKVVSLWKGSKKAAQETMPPPPPPPHSPSAPLGRTDKCKRDSSDPFLMTEKSIHQKEELLEWENPAAVKRAKREVNPLSLQSRVYDLSSVTVTDIEDALRFHVTCGKPNRDLLAILRSDHFASEVAGLLRMSRVFRFAFIAFHITESCDDATCPDTPRCPSWALEALAKNLPSKQPPLHCLRCLLQFSRSIIQEIGGELRRLPEANPFNRSPPALRPDFGDMRKKHSDHCRG